MKNFNDLSFNAEAENKKKWYASILDHLLSFILTILFYFLVVIIFDSSSLVKNVKTKISDSQYELNKIVMNTKLDYFVSENSFTLTGSDKIATDYVKKLVYTSLIENNVSDDEISKEFYTSSDLLTKENDSLYYYQLMFKIENSNDYNAGYKKNDFNSYLNDFVNKSDINIERLIIKDDYFYLNLEDSKNLDAYIRRGETSAGKTLNTSIHAFYYQSLLESIEEVKSYYKPYISSNDIYLKNESMMFSYRHYELLISYLLSIIILYFIIPLFFKNGVTISMKAFKIAIIRKDKKEYFVLINLYRTIYNMFKNVLLLPLVFLILYSISARPLLVSSLIFNIPLIFYPIFSIIIILISFILSMLKKTDNELLDEILFRYKIVDTTSFIKADNEEKGDENE